MPFPVRNPEKPSTAKAKLTVSAAVTFETQTQPPKTVRMTLVGRNPVSLVSAAVRVAKKQLPGAQWLSLVVVLQKEGVAPPPEA